MMIRLFGLWAVSIRAARVSGDDVARGTIQPEEVSIRAARVSGDVFQGFLNRKRHSFNPRRSGERRFHHTQSTAPMKTFQSAPLG